MDNKLNNPDFVVALQRGLAVIECFSQEKQQLSLSEVAALTMLSPATARRALTTLVELGYVGKSGKLFKLRPKVVRLAAGYLSAINLDALLAPLLHKLTEKHGNSASFSILDDRNVLYLAHASTYQVVQINATVGTRFPAYCSSMGRVLLGGLSEEELDNYLNKEKFKKFTEMTLINPAEIKAEIGRAASSGYCIVNKELDPYLISIAVPITNAAGQICAALNSATVSGSVSHESLVHTRLPDLKNVAIEIEAGLVHRPSLLGDPAGD